MVELQIWKNGAWTLLARMDYAIQEADMIALARAVAVTPGIDAENVALVDAATGEVFWDLAHNG